MSAPDPSPGSPPSAATEQDTPGGLGGLVKHSFVYSLVPIVTKVASFAMLPFLWAYLPEEEYGLAQGMGELILAAFAQALGVNVVVSAMSRFFFDRREPRERDAVVSSCTLVLALVSWTVCGLCLAFREPLAPLLLGAAQQDLSRPELVDFLTVLLLIVPFKLSTMAGLTYLQILKRSGAYSTIQLVKMSLELGLKVYTLAWLGWGAWGFMVSILAGEVLTTCTVTAWMLWRVRPRLDWAVFAPIVRYAAPLIPVGLCQVALHTMDRRILVALVGYAPAGIYTAGYLFGQLVNVMVLTPFMQIWQPWIFGVRDEARRADMVARVSTYAVLSVASASLVLILFGREVIEVVVWLAQTLFGRGADSGYLEAYPVLPWVASGYVFWALYAVSQIPLYLAKRTGPLFAINLVAVGANYALNVALIPRYGIVGSGMATLATFALLAAMIMAVGHRAAHVSFELRRLGLILAGVLLAGLVGHGADVGLRDGLSWSVPAVLALKLGTLALVAAGLWGLVLHRAERADLATWLRARLPG